MAANRRPFELQYDLIALIGILLAFSAWMLSLPCFPSTDGPVHMYYADILSALLVHKPSTYLPYFHIRHLLPPYAVYYYALALLSKSVPMFLADQLIICVYFFLFLFGFRYLAQAIGPGGKTTTILATPLLLNWPLGMGFLSFCLSLALSLWAAGLWLRLTGRPSHLRRVLFVCLTVLVMLAHPIPLLLLLLVSGSFLAVRFLQTAQQVRRPGWPRHGRADLLTLTAAALNLLYVRRFSTLHPFDQNLVLTKRQYLADVAYRFTFYGREHALAFFLGRRPDLLVYRGGLLLLLVLPLTLAISQFLRNRQAGHWTTGDTLLCLGATAMLLLPFIPTKLNDCFYFPDRLLICIWLSFLLAASDWSPPPHWRDRKSPPGASFRLNGNHALAICCLFAFFVDGMLLYSANRLLRPVANNIAALSQLAVPADRIGFMVEDTREISSNIHETLSWKPYYWALVNVFRENGDIMANAPWMDESIIPVAPSAPLPEISILTLRQPIPSVLQKDLLRSPRDLHQTFAISSFYLVNQAERPKAQNEPLLHAADRPNSPWSCQAKGWYRICKTSETPPPLL